MTGYRFTSIVAELDPALVHRWLSERSYWALGRSRATHDAAMAASRNYGMLDAVTGQQVACARVVTDGATFAWLCDVFVDEPARGHGVGVALLEGIVADLEPLGLTRTVLATRDAHGLYERFGFEPLANPGMWMLRPGTSASA